MPALLPAGHKLLWQSRFWCSLMPWATRCIFQEMFQAEPKEWGVPFCSPPSAYPTAADVTEDVALNPSGTGSRSPGFNYQNTVWCLDKCHQQQLSGKGACWLLFRRRSQKETHGCISRHQRCHRCVCLQCACQVPYFLHLLRALMLSYSSSR